MSVEERELTALRLALERSSPATQKLLGPLLPLVGVRDLLLSFVRDASRPFEDWVWDPQVRAVLERFRLEDAAAEGRDVDRWYERAASERLEALQSPQEDASAELRRRVESAQQDGRDKFRRGNFYAARNAFARSLDALLELQRDEYYGKAVDPAEWEPEPQRKFVTLCCNVAVCAIKEQDAPVIREFARKALAVDPNATKALYAMAKVHLLEHLHEDAMRILDEARTKDPNNRQWDVLQREIEAAVAKDEREKAELAEIKRKKDEELAAQQLSPEEAEEREKEYKERVQLAAQQVPLPSQEDDALASVRIHTYFMKIKQQLLVEVKQLHESERGESPLFSCSVANGTTGELLANDVRGSSKKSVKNEACKLAIKKLWEQKQAAGTLVEADLEYLAKLRRESSSSNTDSTDALSEQAGRNLGEVPEGVSYPVRLSITQRQLDSVQLLNQLDQQGKLRIRFEFEDVSPHPDSPMFQCTAILNGESVAVAQATKKKKARAMAGDEAKKKAFEKNLLMVWDPPELRKGGDRDDNEAHP